MHGIQKSMYSVHFFINNALSFGKKNVFLQKYQVRKI